MNPTTLTREYVNSLPQLRGSFAWEQLDERMAMYAACSFTEASEALTRAETELSEARHTNFCTRTYPQAQKNRERALARYLKCQEKVRPFVRDGTLAKAGFPDFDLEDIWPDDWEPAEKVLLPMTFSEWQSARLAKMTFTQKLVMRIKKMLKKS